MAYCRIEPPPNMCDNSSIKANSANVANRRERLTMRQDEIAKYTDDKNVLEMQDFSAMPEDERLEDDAYIEAQAIIAGKIHNALRAAVWAKMYRGIHIDEGDIDGLQALLDDLKA